MDNEATSALCGTEDLLKHTIMAPTISSAFGTFVQSLSQIGISILNAIMAVLYAILGLGQTLFASVVQLGQSVLKCKCIVASSYLCEADGLYSGHGSLPGRLRLCRRYVILPACLHRAQSADD